ncbi:MAG: hypothetical protein R3F62_27280 [Planctomycetota bacterium]
MSDARTRELERAGEDPAARVALLNARLRSGELPRWRLELAAVCRDPEAALALGAEALEPVDWDRPLDAFDRFERAVWLRAQALTVARGLAGCEGWTDRHAAWLAGFPEAPGALPSDLRDVLEPAEREVFRDLGDGARLDWPPPAGEPVLRGDRGPCLDAIRALAAWGADLRLRPEEGGGAWVVWLVGSGTRVIATIKELRGLRRWSLAEAKGVVDRADARAFQRVGRRLGYGSAAWSAARAAGAEAARAEVEGELRRWALAR